MYNCIYNEPFVKPWATHLMTKQKLSVEIGNVDRVELMVQGNAPRGKVGIIGGNKVDIYY